MYKKKGGKLKSVAPKRKSRNPSQIRPSPSQNMSESQFSCIFQKPMNRGKYAHMGLLVKCASGKSSCVSKILPVVPKRQRITVSVFLCTLQLTALLLKRFCLRFHCYTLTVVNIYTCTCVNIYIYICVCVCVSVCLCLCLCLCLWCVCVCVCLCMTVSRADAQIYGPSRYPRTRRLARVE